MTLIWILISFVVSLHIASTSSEASADFEYDLTADNSDRCTTIGVGSMAMIDGSTISTHNNDCFECDYRITHVPARDWPEGSKRPIYNIKDSYPRYIESPDSINIHGPDYHPDKVDTFIYSWVAREPIAWIDQVPHTYAYTLGTYAIQNEKQVSIGESTCGAIFVAKPIFDGGNASLAMETLTELALERCDSARCAIETMGSLAERHGFYGPEWKGASDIAHAEAGEGLIVSDQNEAWVFHILPDDTGSSAIWIGQRIPDDHITVIANQFIIGYVDVQDHENFIFSSNLIAIALKHKLWDPESGKPLHFTNVYGANQHKTGYACTRRVWRVFTLAAPSLANKLSPYTNALQSFGYGDDGSEPYPFSVKPDHKLTLQDIMNINRDQYEGTSFDLTKGLDSGPFGDPMRFMPRSDKIDPIEGVSWEHYQAGLGYQRPISLWRTSYSSIAQGRKNLPDVLGAVTWIAQYAPHFSTFVPVFASATQTPSTLKAGTLFRLNKLSNWWIHCLTGNYLSRWYRFSIVDVKQFQRVQENKIFNSLNVLENQILSLNKSQESLDHIASTLTEVERKFETMLLESFVDSNNVLDQLTAFQEVTATEVLSDWWDFFFTMAGKYRDLYVISSLHAPEFSAVARYLTVTRSWLESIGFWGAPFTPPPGNDSPLPVRTINVPSHDSLDEYASTYPRGLNASYVWPFQYESIGVASYPSNWRQKEEQIRKHYDSQRWFDWAIGVVVGVLGSLILLHVWRRYNNSNNYLPIH